MIEDYFDGITRTQVDASTRAIALAKEVNGSDWNHGNWPTNSMLNSDGTRESYYIESVEGMFDLLYNFGPVYAFYQCDHGAHLVVVTGVDKRRELVYTNNPWGISEVQVFDQFLISFTGRISTEPFPFMYCLIPIK